MRQKRSECAQEQRIGLYKIGDQPINQNLSAVSLKRKMGDRVKTSKIKNKFAATISFRRVKRELNDQLKISIIKNKYATIISLRWVKRQLNDQLKNAII